MLTYIRQSERQIPVVRNVDVVVAGGTIAGVAAACAAAGNGLSVLLVTSRPYLGEDLCGSLRLWHEDGVTPTGEISRAIFERGNPATPMRVKRELASALDNADVEYLLSSFVTEIVRDESGHSAGVVLTNRAGRQAIVSKVIIDATSRARVARMAGALAKSWTPSDVIARRVLLGRESLGDGAESRIVPAGIDVDGEPLFYFEYEMRVDLECDDFVSLARAEQQIRDATYRTGQLRASETAHFVLPEAVRVQNPAYRLLNMDRMFLAGGQDESGRSPDESERFGNRIGTAAADKARKLESPKNVHVGNSHPASVEDSAEGDVREILSGLRPTDTDLDTVTSEVGGVPVIGEFDVAVIGGGTAGAAAAIGAARRGAKVLLVEYQEGLGGTGTLGLIGRPYHGKNIGFAREVPFPNRENNMEHKLEWYRSEIRKAGGELWLGAIGCGVYAEGDKVKGAILATTEGRRAVMAKVVIDGTGSADLACAAGAEVMHGANENDLALQGSGLPVRPPDESYVNTDYLVVDEADMLDVRTALSGAPQAMSAAAYDVGPLIQTRERRRVVGDHVLSYLDQIAERTFPDTVVYSASDYDSHGYPSHFYFALIPHDDETKKLNHPAPGGSCYTPYRALLPKGLDGILVIGLGISMDRDASAMIRMQRDIANQGYAAGVAASMVALEGKSTRDIDIRALQEHLINIGSLPESVMELDDSYPLSDSEVGRVVELLAVDDMSRRQEVCKALAIVLSHVEQARPRLLERFRSSVEDAQLVYAKILGFLSETEVVPVLCRALNKVTEWDPKILQGRMAEYAHLPTPVDALVWSLGHTRDPAALPSILRMADLLNDEVTLSHHRSVALALEHLRDPQAVPALVRLLEKPGMRGHQMTSVEPLHDREVELRRRNGPLREIVLARALYRCGDHQGTGRSILENYSRDLRGLFARHACAVLSAHTSA